MIGRTKLPDFLQDMPEERLKEIMEVNNNNGNFDKDMDKMLHTNKKKGKNLILPCYFVTFLCIGLTLHLQNIRLQPH